MLALRSTLFNLLFYALLILLLIVGLPTLALGRGPVLRLAGVWSRASLTLLRVICGTHVVVRGLEHRPERACIVASKHQSFLEIIVFCGLFRDFSFVFKRELTRIPLFGWYLSASRQIAVDRGQGRSALTEVSRRAAEVLAEGRHLIIFPEGTRRPPDAPPEYKSGIAFIYFETGVSCLPVAVNSGLYWPRRSYLRRPGTIVIELLPPIPPGIERAAFQTRMRDAIEAASQALMAESVEADPGLAGLLADAAAPAA